MTTKFSILFLFVVSVSCAPPETPREDVQNSDVKAVVDDKVNGYNILPMYEIKSVPESHTSICSPNCYKEIYDKPVYLVLKSGTPKEPEVLYIKEGLKAYRPKDKTKLFEVIGKAVGIIFSKFDFPDDKYPHIDKYVKRLEVLEDVPYVLITNEEDLAEINRNEKYDKVAEMEVSSEGFVTRVVGTHRAEYEEKIDEKLYGRKIETLIKEENEFPRKGKLPISFLDLLRYLSLLSSLKSKLENSQYKPLNSQTLFYKLLKFLLRPSDDSSKYSSKYDDLILENLLNPNKVQNLGDDLQNVPIKLESIDMNYNPGYETFNNDFRYYPKHWYSEPNYDHEPNSYYNMNYVNNIPNYPEVSSDVMQGLTDYDPHKSWREEYESFNQKPYYNLNGGSDFNRGKFTNMDFRPMLYSPHPFSSGLNYGSHPKYPSYMSPQVPFWQSSSYYSPAASNSYSSDKLHYSFLPQYSYLSQSGKPYTPLKYNTPYYNPGATYVFNVCQGQRPHYYYPEIEAASENHGPIMPSSPYPSKPEHIPGSHEPFNGEQPSKSIPTLTSSKNNLPSEEFYKRLEPSVSFKNTLNKPDTDESGTIRFIGYPKHENAKYNRPIQLYSQNYIFPNTNNNYKRPPLGTIPSGYIPESQ